MADPPPLTAGSVPLDALPAIVAVTDGNGTVVGASGLWLAFADADLPAPSYLKDCRRHHRCGPRGRGTHRRGRGRRDRGPEPAVRAGVPIHPR